MRRLFWLVAAVVLVDTMFFAAVAPLLPHYSDELNLSKTAVTDAGVEKLKKSLPFYATIIRERLRPSPRADGLPAAEPDDIA